MPINVIFWSKRRWVESSILQEKSPRFPQKAVVHVSWLCSVYATRTSACDRLQRFCNNIQRPFHHFRIAGRSRDCRGRYFVHTTRSEVIFGKRLCVMRAVRARAKKTILQCVSESVLLRTRRAADTHTARVIITHLVPGKKNLSQFRRFSGNSQLKVRKFPHAPRPDIIPAIIRYVF